MSLSVSGTSGYATTAMMNMGHRHRPDPSQLASDLFSKIDSSGKGYIDKTDLQNALNGLSSSSSSTSSDSSTASVDDIFSSLDTDGDGKVTEQEMSSSLSKIADELEAQANSARMDQARGQMPPPPPPDGADSAGLTKDQLTQMASDVQSSDSNLSSDLTQLVQNFSAADTNGDGKISMQEAMAYKQKTEAASAGATTTSDGTTSTSTTSSTDTQRDAAILHRVMQLLASYRTTESASTTTASTVATSA